MIKIKLLTAFILLSAVLVAQNNTIPNDTIYTVDKLEKLPSFPGGEDEMMQYIRKNIIYPQIEKEADVMGTVYVGFVIDLDGSITDVTVLKGVTDGPGLDAEAVRIIKQMPKWNPGIQYGHTVKCKFTLPIKYSISNGKKGKKKKG